MASSSPSICGAGACTDRWGGPGTPRFWKSPRFRDRSATSHPPATCPCFLPLTLSLAILMRRLCTSVSARAVSSTPASTVVSKRNCLSSATYGQGAGPVAVRGIAQRGTTSMARSRRSPRREWCVAEEGRCMSCLGRGAIPSHRLHQYAPCQCRHRLNERSRGIDAGTGALTRAARQGRGRLTLKWRSTIAEGVFSVTCRKKEPMTRL